MEKIQLLYIDMCYKAKEVQDMWKPAIGDYYHHFLEKKVFLITNNATQIDKYMNKWLPTEKQLFKIIRRYGIFDWRTFDLKSIDYYNHFLQWIKDHPTKEICALGAVMDFCFHKRWQAGSWIKFYDFAPTQPVKNKSV